MTPQQSSNGQWFFTIKAKNGAKIATSETYKTRAGCVKGIKAAMLACIRMYNKGLNLAQSSGM